MTDENSNSEDLKTENQNSENPDPTQQQSESSRASAKSGLFDINQIIDTTKAVISNPVAFYRSMPQTGGYENPVVFVAVMAFAFAAISFVLSIIGLGGGFFLGLILMPVAAVIGSFIGGGILFVIWKLMGSEKEYEVAYRCVAFSFAIMPVIAVVQIIPYLGGIIQTLWASLLMYVASIEVHKLKAQTAQIVFGILAFILVVAGVKSEHTTRKWESYAERLSEQTKKSLNEGSIGKALESFENAEDLTPEEAGKQLGEFMKGLEDFAKGLEESVEETEQEAQSN